MRHWNRLARGSVDVPALEVFKARLDGALSNLVKGIPAHSRGLGTRWSSKIHSNPNQSMILIIPFGSSL